MAAAKFAAERSIAFPLVCPRRGREVPTSRLSPWEMNVLTDTREQVYELHWMRHAERYIALVRAALEKDPEDEQLLELLQAMEAALAKKMKRPLH
jgi:hypothetical protein